MQVAVTTRVMSSQCLQIYQYVKADAVDDDGIWKNAEIDTAARAHARDEKFQYVLQ